MAWLGQPVLIEELLFKSPTGSWIRACTRAWARSRPTATGSAWAGTGPGTGPAIYRSVSPAWGDPNLRELAAHVESPLFMTHVRAAIGSPVQETNCHPFRRGNWLFVHNGFIADFHLLRRDLMLAIDPELFADVQGSTDTEVVFHLALTLGLEEDPIGALERTVGLIEETARRHGVTNAVQATFGVSDGDEPVGGALRERGPARVRCSPRPTPTRSGTSIPTTRASSALTERRPPDRLGAVLRPARRLARDP